MELSPMAKEKVIEKKPSADAARSAMQRLAPQLLTVSPRARKLLLQIAELAYESPLKERSSDTAYFPELYDSCGLGVEEMYELLRELHAAKLIELEGDYPFEDVKIPTGNTGPLADLTHYYEGNKAALREAIVEMRPDTLK